MCSSVLQCVAVYCSVLQCFAFEEMFTMGHTYVTGVCCSALQRLHEAAARPLAEGHCHSRRNIGGNLLNFCFRGNVLDFGGSTLPQ